MEDELRCSASVVAVAGGGAAAGGAAEAEEKTEFDVELTELTDAKAKVKVIKEIRGITGLGLKDAKALVAGAPAIVKEAVEEDAAADIKLLEAVGGKVTIK